MHSAIREDPAAQKKERSKPSETKLWKAKKLTYDERKEKLKVLLLLLVQLPWPFCVALHCFPSLPLGAYSGTAHVDDSCLGHLASELCSVFCCCSKLPFALPAAG